MCIFLTVNQLPINSIGGHSSTELLQLIKAPSFITTTQSPKSFVFFQLINLMNYKNREESMYLSKALLHPKADTGGN